MTEADLSGCADEPIRVPGAVQPHGALVACTEPELRVVVASANAAEVLRRSPAGAGLADLLGQDVAGILSTGNLAEVNPLRATVAGREVVTVLAIGRS